MALAGPAEKVGMIHTGARSNMLLLEPGGVLSTSRHFFHFLLPFVVIIGGCGCGRGRHRGLFQCSLPHHLLLVACLSIHARRIV